MESPFGLIYGIVFCSITLLLSKSGGSTNIAVEHLGLIILSLDFYWNISLTGYGVKLLAELVKRFGQISKIISLRKCCMSFGKNLQSETYTPQSCKIVDNEAEDDSDREVEYDGRLWRWIWWRWWWLIGGDDYFEYWADFAQYSSLIFIYAARNVL